MPRDRDIEWVDVGRMVRQPELKQTLERLQEAGILRVADGRLSLAIGLVCQQSGRAEFATLLRCVLIDNDEKLDNVEKSDIKLKTIDGRLQRLLLEDPMADHSLGDIYRHIPSPPPIEAPHPEGVKTDLFRYQLHSLRRMLQREEEPEMVQSDHWIPFRSGIGQLLYLHPSTLEVKVVAPSLNSKLDARGGILSEEMGSGKTLEIISLILSTRGLLPGPDDDPMASKITSSLAMQWPHREDHGLDPIPQSHLKLEKIPYYSADVESQGRPFSLPNEMDVPAPSPSPSPSDRRTRKLPSLRHLCAHVVRLSGQSIAPDQYSEEDAQIAIRAMEPLLKSATPFYHLWPPLRGHRTPRVDVQRTPVKVYLSTATLVVVPGTLLAQWQGEINKHTMPGSLRVLCLPHAHSKLPPAIDLANEYDLILLSHARLGKEHSEGSLEWNWPSVPRICRCPYIGSSRIVECKCPKLQVYEPSKDMSPLLQCKFKRLCVDEGHVAAGDSDMVRMATKIRSDCRWIISGTPTESLVGSDLYRTHSSNNHRNLASKTEQKDLEKLHALLSDFLGVPQLQDWHSYYENPFKKGSMYASTRLWKLLSRVMVRNQPQDIDYSLPPLLEQIVRLDFTRLERATFNVLQSLILLNAIWSQREDDDYFFHHSNRKHLASIMENLSLSCFHFAGPNLQEQAEEALAHACKQLAKEGQWCKVDREQVELANRHLDEALCDNEWKNRSSDVVFGTMGLQSEIVKRWSRQGTVQLQLSAEEIMAMQRAVRMILEQQASGELESGDMETTEELITLGERNRRAFLEKQAKTEQRKKRDSSDSFERQVTHSALASLPPSSPIKKTSNSRKVNKMGLLDYTKLQYEERERLPSNSELCLARLQSGSSTKLVKLLEIISGVPQDEKVIIFSNLDNVLYEVSTALDIARLPHFIYASGSSQDRRNEVISAFRSEQASVRILLMKINIGGRGLDLSCANHAIFLEPILDKSLRVQALKRTWRTGQTRPVHATTLIIKETFEEDILRISETGSTHKLSEDPSMRQVVSNPTFVSSGTRFANRTLSPPINLFHSQSDSPPTLEIPLPTPPISPDKQWMVKSEDVFHSVDSKAIPFASTFLYPTSHRPSSLVNLSRPTKKRRVTFA